MLQAVAARHRCVSHYHAETGTAVSVFDEATLSIGGPLETISRIVKIEIDGVLFEVDPVRRAIHHPEHSDPAVPFPFNGKWWIQVFLCDGRYRSDLPASVRVWTLNGQCIVGPITEHLSDDSEMTSKLEGAPGSRFIEFKSSVQVQAILQTSSCGVESEETIGMFNPGTHSIDVIPIHSERYGICLSSGDAFGGIEHKHMIHGQGGHASGRILIDSAGTWWPKVREQFAYRSTVVIDDGGEWIDNVVRDPTIDEVEIWTSVARAGALNNMISASALNGRKVVTHEAKSALNAAQAQILVLDPDDDIPYGKTLAFMLFRDQSDPGFADRLEGAMRRIASIPRFIPVIERAWLGSRDVPSMTMPHYGIGFSRSTEMAAAAKVNLFKRLEVPTFDPCGRCQVRKECLSLVATPLASALLPNGAVCKIRLSLKDQFALKSTLDSDTRSSTMRAAASVA